MSRSRTTLGCASVSRPRNSASANRCPRGSAANNLTTHALSSVVSRAANVSPDAPAPSRSPNRNRAGIDAASALSTTLATDT